MASMRGAAAEAYEDKLGRMGLKIRTASMGEDVGKGHVGAEKDGTQGTVANGYADDYKSEAANEHMVSEKAGKPRLDRKGYKKGGRVKGTTVNVIVAPQGGAPAGGPPVPPPMPMPAPAAGPGGPPPMSGGMPGAAPLPRKRGGRVPMKAGAGGGEGRLEKIKEYGARAKPGGKAGTM